LNLARSWSRRTNFPRYRQRLLLWCLQAHRFLSIELQFGSDSPCPDHAQINPKHPLDGLLANEPGLTRPSCTSIRLWLRLMSQFAGYCPSIVGSLWLLGLEVGGSSSLEISRTLPPLPRRRSRRSIHTQSCTPQCTDVCMCVHTYLCIVSVHTSNYATSSRRSYFATVPAPRERKNAAKTGIQQLNNHQATSPVSDSTWLTVLPPVGSAEQNVRRAFHAVPPHWFCAAISRYDRRQMSPNSVYSSLEFPGPAKRWRSHHQSLLQPQWPRD
jgi:hypothetical protein